MYGILASMAFEEMMIKETAKRFAESELMPRVQTAASLRSLQANCLSISDGRFQLLKLLRKDIYLNEDEYCNRFFARSRRVSVMSTLIKAFLRPNLQFHKA